MKNNSEIKVFPPKIPEFIRPYLEGVMSKSIKGRDAEFCSRYMEKALDAFPWSSHGFLKPQLWEFCRWGMSVCKGGLSLNKTGRRKVINNKDIKVDKLVKTEIINEVESIIGGKIQDSFLGSPKYFEEYDKFYTKYNITHPIFAKILVSRRKQGRTNAPKKIYVYKPSPISRPNDYKFGRTKGDPHKRMHDETRNTRSEQPEMIAWFFGTDEDETRIINCDELKSYKNSFETFGNREMFVIPHISIVIKIMKEEIEKNDGKIYFKGD